MNDPNCVETTCRTMDRYTIGKIIDLLSATASIDNTRVLWKQRNEWFLIVAFNTTIHIPSKFVATFVNLLHEKQRDWLKDLILKRIVKMIPKQPHCAARCARGISTEAAGEYEKTFLQLLMEKELNA